MQALHSKYTHKATQTDVTKLMNIL